VYGLAVAAGWGIVGLAVGVGVRAASVWLARGEGLEPGRRRWQTYGPVVLTGLLFGLFAWRMGLGTQLLIRSLWLAVLVQVIFFDFEHQLILDRVLLPAGLAAAALSFFTPGLGVVQSLLTGLVTGIVFLVLALAGSLLFKAEAMGFGDVKFSVFMGLVLGPRATFSAVVVGFIVAGLVAIGLVLLRLRSMRDSIPYGPFLAAGAVAALFTFSTT